MNDKNKEISVSLLTFTFFYSIAIYILLIGFYFWLSAFLAPMRRVLPRCLVVGGWVIPCDWS